MPDKNDIIVESTKKEKILSIAKTVGKGLLMVLGIGGAAFIGAHFGASDSINSMLDAVEVDGEEIETEDDDSDDQD